MLQIRDYVFPYIVGPYLQCLNGNQFSQSSLSSVIKHAYTSYSIREMKFNSLSLLGALAGLASAPSKGLISNGEDEICPIAKVLSDQE